MSTLTKSIVDSLLQASNYMPYVYTQLAIDQGHIFTIRYPFEEIPENSLLFVLPIRNSQAVNSLKPYNLLKLLTPQITLNPLTGETVINYDGASRQYKILIEDLDGTLSAAGLNCLAANRLAIFRFIGSDPTSVVLINNPQYHNLQATSLMVNQATVFRSIPTYEPDPNDSVNKTKLALESQVIALENRLTALENKFVYGTAEADVALADKPDGTIYIKIEDE